MIFTIAILLYFQAVKHPVDELKGGHIGTTPWPVNREKPLKQCIYIHIKICVHIYKNMYEKRYKHSHT
jgi:hypothetical protein